MDRRNGCLTEKKYFPSTGQVLKIVRMRVIYPV
jgi:hypothetical protein